MPGSKWRLFVADLRWWLQATPIEAILVVVGDAGLRHVRFHADRADAPVDAVEERDRSIAGALDDWFAARTTTLPFELDWTGISDFRRSVLETLRAQVPWGETVTYGELAALAGRPRAARAVGTVMASNPFPFVVPCHRVVASNGIGGYGGTRQGSVPRSTSSLGPNDGEGPFDRALLHDDPAARNLAVKRWLLRNEGVHV
jgi:methylated-DNA-[protein]-cysteine S-methyltransferase